MPAKIRTRAPQASPSREGQLAALITELATRWQQLTGEDAGERIADDCRRIRGGTAALHELEKEELRTVAESLQLDLIWTPIEEAMRRAGIRLACGPARSSSSGQPTPTPGARSTPQASPRR